MRTEIVLMWAAVTAYMLGAILFVVGVVFRKDRVVTVALWISVAGLAPHAIAIGARWARVDHGPYLGFYEVVSSYAFASVAVLGMLSLWRRNLRIVGVVIMPLALLLLGGAMLAPTSPLEITGTLASYWLTIHVTFAKLTYASFTAAFAIAIVYLVRDGRAAKKSSATHDRGGLPRDPQLPRADQASGDPGTIGVLAVNTDSDGLRDAPITAGGGVTSLAVAADAPGLLDRLPAQEVLDDLQLRLVGVGFIFLTVMIAAGAIWANEAWGRYWAWDPIETWSLISWIIYAVYLHLRLTMGWRERRAAWYAVVSLPVIVFTLVGVPIVYSSIHGAYLTGY